MRLVGQRIRDRNANLHSHRDLEEDIGDLTTETWDLEERIIEELDREDETLERLDQAGEILRNLAATDPVVWDTGYYCTLCKKAPRRWRAMTVPEHNPACLWRRAVEWVQVEDGAEQSAERGTPEDSAAQPGPKQEAARELQP